MDKEVKKKEGKGLGIHTAPEDIGSMVEDQKADAIGLAEVKLVLAADTEPRE